ncbi:heavy metal transporter [Natronococcus pandeyae]|uniref:Heavy metal transporter n=1 Tax=Natronococcus pandeyae TaxID=2055836 RepID=A0A8J8TNA4_9EURY|nr:heavy metal-associated domain-containing protein [Natronococcus pandeyae]TYL36456.1 heavy metal transporter [Natronococcus pandeyae]
MERKTLTVTGMSCDGCERHVTSALRALEDVTRVEADHETDTVEVVAGEDVADDELAAAIRDAGYEATA